MQPTDDAPPASPAEDGLACAAELVVLNGRLNGTRRRLTGPVTLIGQAENCDIRLNVEGVHPFHCVLAWDSTGLHLRDFPGDGSTLVNEEPVADRLLHNGDLLSVGPFQFRVHLSRPSLREEPCEGEKEALRIQAAAVAAQQAALLEQEIRLEQRQSAFRHQEQQLAGHLEEERQRLLALQKEAEAARAALLQERTGYERRVQQVMRTLAESRHELADRQRTLKSQRKVLSGFRKRLKHRWHRHWTIERAAMRNRAAELDQLQRRLQQEAEQLQHERSRLEQARLHLNGETELARRQQQAEWDQLQKTRSHGQEQARALERREAALLDSERNLAEETRRWNEVRLRLYKEVEGLEKRVRNYRQKILDQEQEIFALAVSQNNIEIARPLPPASSADSAAPAESQQLARPVDQDRAEYAEQLAALERLSQELADQRLCLAEQCERLVQAHQRWHHERTSSFAALEDLGQQLQEREHTLRSREQALEHGEYDLRRRFDDVAERRKQAEALRARLTAAALAWEAERDRLLAEVHAREQGVHLQVAAIRELRQRWEERRRRQVLGLRSQRQTYEQLRRECARLREEWLQRSAALNENQRLLAERELAMEQYRQECLNEAADPRAAERRLERLGQRWSASSASARRQLAAERGKLKAEWSRLETRANAVEKLSNQITNQEAELSGGHAVWEEKLLLAEAEQTRLQEQLRATQAQRTQLEQQLQELREQLEYLARLLIDEPSGPAPIPVAKAA